VFKRGFKPRPNGRGPYEARSAESHERRSRESYERAVASESLEHTEGIHVHRRTAC